MTRLRLGVCYFAVMLGALSQPDPAWSITAGQIDDFQDGTTQGWSVGGTPPVPPMNVSSGGPEGVGDAYLELNSHGGAGAGSRLAVDNAVQWTDDYLNGGFTHIVIDASLFSSPSVSLRLALSGPGGAFVSADPVVVPSFTNWQLIEFSLDPADLIAVPEGGGSRPHALERDLASPLPQLRAAGVGPGRHPEGGADRRDPRSRQYRSGSRAIELADASRWIGTVERTLPAATLIGAAHLLTLKSQSARSPHDSACFISG